MCVFFFLSLKFILRQQRSLAKNRKKERKEGIKKKRENFFIPLSEFSSALPFCCRCDLAEK